LIRRKSCTYLVVVLFVGINLFSSLGLSHGSFNQSSEQIESLAERGYFYGYCAYDPSGQHLQGPVTFDTPYNIVSLGPGICPNFLSCADVDTMGNWYGIDYAGGLYLIEFDGTMTFIAPTIGMQGLSYNTETDNWFGCSGSILWSVDVTTGASTIICDFGPSLFLCDIAFDYDNTLYGIGYDGEEFFLCILNYTTGEATEIGPLNLYLFFDAAYDRNNGVLYINGKGNNDPNAFYTCDIFTGECILVDYFEGDMDVDGIMVPYTLPFLIAEFAWTPTNPGAGETILFNASMSYDSDGYITLYEWDWDNDGVFEESQSRPTTTYSWENPGDYTVTLRITDNIGDTAVKTKILHIINHPPLTPIIYGPTNGRVNIGYPFSLNPVTDPEGDSMYVKWEWGDGNNTEWLGPYASGQTISETYGWTHPGVNEIRAKLKDAYGAESNWSDPHVMTIVDNSPPDSPDITGPVKGKPGTNYLYVFETADPEGDDVYYMIDWGDETNSSWLGPYNSGVQKSAGHRWNQKGTYVIKIKAKDIWGSESDWKTLSVTIPFSHGIPVSSFFDWLFTHFPHAFPILRHLLSNSGKEYF